MIPGGEPPGMALIFSESEYNGYYQEWCVLCATNI